jgi:Uma2 family endonuclease
MYQIQFPSPPAETLPTMYDLPSEDPEEPGLPDQFHEFQPSLLRETCKPSTASASDFFVGVDLNLYYDLHHTKWYKRPDWFVVTGVQAPVQQDNLRWSYVTWQEGVNPFLVVELLSPGTEDEDLGRNLREIGKPPTKWEVYERILRVPFYVVYDRYDNHLRVFAMQGDRYQEVSLDANNPRFWLEKLGLGLGLWQGQHKGVEGRWLRWYDANGQWISTAIEAKQVAEAQAETDRSAREAAEAQAETDRSAREAAETQAETDRSAREAAEAKLTSAIPQLLNLGLTTEQIANSLGLTIAQVEAAIELKKPTVS